MVLAVALLVGGCALPYVRKAVTPAEDAERHVQVPVHLEAALAAAPECCAPGAALPASVVAGWGSIDALIGPHSPVVPLPRGRSYASAWRIDQLPRPFLVEVASLRAADPVLGPDAPASARDLVLVPVVLVLDARGEVQRVHSAGRSSPACTDDPTAPAYRIDVPVVESPDRAATLIVATTPALRSRSGEVVCGVVRHGMSPVGRLNLRFRAIDIPVEPGPLQVWPARLLDPAPGLTRLPLPASSGAPDGWLVAGESTLNVVVPDAGRLKASVTVPLSALVAVRELAPDETGAPGLRVLAVPGSWSGDARRLGDGLVEHRIHLPQGASRLAARLSGAMSRDRWVESVEVEIERRVPEIDFRTDRRHPLVHIGDRAITGGGVAALPCTVCQSGLCTPETLASCGALFSIGAALGGVVGAGQEVAQRISPEGQATLGALGRLEANVRREVKGAQDAAFHQVALAQCVSGAFDALPPDARVAQGRAAAPRVALAESAEIRVSDPGAPAASTRSAERRPSVQASVSVDRVSLVMIGPEARGAPAAMVDPVRMQVVATLAIRRDGVDLPVGRLEWLGAAFPRTRWESEASERAASELREACIVLGRAAAGRVLDAWRTR